MHSLNPLQSVAQTKQPRSLGHPEPTASDGPWRDVKVKRRERNSTLKSSSNPLQQPPKDTMDQCLIVRRLPETRAYTGSMETRHDIDAFSKTIKQIILPGEVIAILKTHPLSRRVANLPSSRRNQREVHVTPSTSVSSKSSAGLGEFYELNAFHTNVNLQTQLRLPQNCLPTSIERND